MQEIQAGQAGDLMAAWRASGGAMEALAAEPETGDDGMAATSHSHYYPACADDGLHAAQTLGPSFGAECFNGDDGLKAAMNSEGGMPCFADDGLAAMAHSARFACADDGLAATAYSHRWPYCLAE